MPTNTLLRPPGERGGAPAVGERGPLPELRVGDIDQATGGRGPIPEFLAGDIILFAARQDLYGRFSRWLMRTGGERPTYAVHTAQFLDAGRYLELDIVVKIRATPEIFRKRLAHDLWQRRGFVVWRCRTLTSAQREAVTQQALAYLGARFGLGKFLTHLLDGLTTKVVGREVFFFRRLNHDQRYPICCWITAFSYDRALHYRFGVSPECADPDQIDDWLNAHPEEWRCVFRFEHVA
jgi:hypothetical protein